MGLANQLTIFRILLVPVFVIFIGYNKPLYALITFFIAGLTDALDGFIARKFNQVTTLGKILDPIADKTLLVCSFIFIYNSDMSVKFPFWYVVLVISRDIYILLGSGVIYFLKGNLEIKPSIFGKATTFFQILSVITVLVANIYPIDMIFVEGVIYTATVFTIFSAITYFQEGLQKLK
ncbi:CDP-diacylglycerol--glycerol-3-phosphate 3-phosphatidyltransferase [Persephonella sp.]